MVPLRLLPKGLASSEFYGTSLQESCNPIMLLQIKLMILNAFKTYIRCVILLNVSDLRRFT